MIQLLRVPVKFASLGVMAIAALWAGQSSALSLGYKIQPQDLGGGCYAVVGSTDYFSSDNGGFIVNTGFIVTDEGVLVIDTGPSKRFGEEFRQVINGISGNKPIDRVIITHGHPDHYLGNQAFADTPIYSGEKTIAMIDNQGEDFTVNMYRLVGDWMRGTESVSPTHPLTTSRLELGGHTITVMSLEGHTEQDQLVYDETCGVVYAGDLVFNQRTLATPHADIEKWKDSLMLLQTLRFDKLVPGHGPVSDSKEPMEQSLAYLEWLETVLIDAYSDGFDITEVMEIPIPKEFRRFALARDEFRRTVQNLYPAIEAAYLPAANQ